jgi:hypothetical protein
MRAKVVKQQARRHHRLAGPNAPTAFGDSITADHPLSASERGEGADGEKYAMVVLDLGTQWKDCYPSAERDAAQSRVALQGFIGPRTYVTTPQCDARA